VKSKWLTNSLKQEKLQQPLLKMLVEKMFLAEDFNTQNKGIQLFGYTEYKRGKYTFRCHPNYKNEGPWFDYVLIAWEQEETESGYIDDDSMEEKLHEPISMKNNLKPSNIKLIPAKLICFIKNHKNEMNVILHSCLGLSEKLSVLTYKWELEYEKEKKKSLKSPRNFTSDDTSKLSPVYHCVSVDTIQKHCLMIPMHTTSRFLIQVVDQDKWADAFTYS